MAHAWDSSEISSGVFVRRASRNTCCPSTVSIPSRRSAASTGISATSMPSGASATPCSRSSAATCRATSSAIPACGWNAPRSVEIPARAPVRAAPSGVAGPGV